MNQGAGAPESEGKATDVRKAGVTGTWPHMAGLEMACLSSFILVIKESYCYYYFPRSGFSFKSLLGLDVAWL